MKRFIILSFLLCLGIFAKAQVFTSNTVFLINEQEAIKAPAYISFHQKELQINIDGDIRYYDIVGTNDENTSDYETLHVYVKFKNQDEIFNVDIVYIKKDNSLMICAQRLNIAFMECKIK